MVMDDEGPGRPLLGMLISGNMSLHNSRTVMQNMNKEECPGMVCFSVRGVRGSIFTSKYQSSESKADVTRQVSKWHSPASSPEYALYIFRRTHRSNAMASPNLTISYRAQVTS